MTIGEHLYQLQISFLEKYSEYSKAAIDIAKKLASGQPVTAEDHKKREQLFDTFSSEFSKHKRLQFHVLEKKIDLTNEYQAID